LRWLNENHKIFTQQTQALAFLAVFVYATHAMQVIAFGWKLGLSKKRMIPLFKFRTGNDLGILHPRNDVIFGLKVQRSQDQ